MAGNGRYGTLLWFYIFEYKSTSMVHDTRWNVEKARDQNSRIASNHFCLSDHLHRVQVVESPKYAIQKWKLKVKLFLTPPPPPPNTPENKSGLHVPTMRVYTDLCGRFSDIKQFAITYILLPCKMRCLHPFIVVKSFSTRHRHARAVLSFDMQIIYRVWILCTRAQSQRHDAQNNKHVAMCIELS